MVKTCHGDNIMTDKITIYFAQLTHTKNNTNQNRSFPLAAGIISQYLIKKFENLIDIKLFKTADKLNKALLLQQPDVLLLSNYLWNENLACAFAKIAKKMYPDLLIIMGGPNLNTSKEKNFQLLNNNAAIDKFVFHEGEIPVSLLIENFILHRNVQKVKSLEILNTMSITSGAIFYNDNFDNETKKIGYNLDELPSPYLVGMFDEFFMNGEVPLIETSRGCPFTCAFCQQGNEKFKRIRNFSVERIAEELEYIAQKIHKNNLKMDSMYIADSNFAMYERDGEILKKIRETQDKYNYPKDIICSTGKNNAELIIRNTSILKRGSILLRNSVQSLDKETLQAIHRSNIKMEAYRKIQDYIVEIGMESSADIMLALPKETKDSHFKGIYELIDTGTKEITCLQTIALRGTKFDEPDYIQQYNIKTKKRVIPACFNSYDIGKEKIEIVEFDNVIIENNTLSFVEYLECRKLHLIVMTFHNTRLLDPIYEVFKHRNIKKSLLCTELFNLNNSGLNDIIKSFLKETKDELFEDFVEFKKKNLSLESVTSNKIFRHLSISFYRKKETILIAIKEILHNIFKKEESLVNDLINILDLSIISPFENLDNRLYEIQNHDLKQIMGQKIEIKISEKQVSMINMLNELFNNPEDKINIMAYHLKPSNMTRQIQYA